MNKKLRILQCLFLSGVILITSQHKAEAFLPIPPLPPSFEVDIPGNIGKVVSNLKAVYKKVQTIASELNSINLDAIKGCVTGGKGCEELLKVAALAKKHIGQTKKTPGKGKIKENTELGIAEGDVNEFNYFNAYHKLFFTYPDAASMGVDHAVIRAAYKSRATEYRQDILIDTYLAGRLTEDYLFLVEKTIERLDSCQKGAEEGKNCVFFGMQMDKVGTDDGEKPDGDTPSAGQIGAAKNAYIVTMVYDRLMRIVEDLTATEAIYRASQQIDLGTPINESNAEKYVGQKYHFAYTDANEKTYAAGLLSKKIRLDKDGSGYCQKGAKGCPGYNDASATLTNLDDTAILERLQPIDDELDKAVLLHNFKVQLPSYKTQYRKYLKAVEIHKRALAALEQSDKCVIDFLKSYGTNSNQNWTTMWRGNITKANDHENRLGISRALIEEYQENINETIIGNTSACPHYYESCPDGYVIDTSDSCEDNGRVLHPCSIEMIEGDAGDEAEPVGVSPEDVAGRRVDETVDNSSYNDADELLDASGADKIDQSNRLRAEQTWQIGSKKMVELAQKGILSFEPWNDQQQLQDEYLRNKYRNIKLIVQSADQGVGAYKIATDLAGSADSSGTDAEIANDINKYISAISRCMSVDQAITEAKKQFCQYTQAEKNCNVTNNNGILTGKKQVRVGYDDKGRAQWEWREQQWNQKVSLTNENSCDFKATPQTLATGGTNQNCNGSWDLTAGFLVKNYLPKTLGGCKASKQNQVTNFYTDAHSKGRVVAQSKLDGVLTVRQDEEQKMVKFIEDYETQQQTVKAKLQNLKDKISKVNSSISTATKTKNIAQKELNRATKRIKAIKDDEEKTGEWYELEDKKASAKELAKLNKQSGEEQESLNATMCTIEKQQLKLMFERNAIQGKSQKDLNAEWKCPEACTLAAQETSSKENLADKIALLCRENLYVNNHRVSLSSKLGANNPDKEESHYVNPEEATNRIAQEKEKIKRLKATRDTYKKQIDALNKQIQEKADKFAEDYIDMAESNQENIENANEEFESFLEKLEEDNKRMENAQDIICLKKGFLGICTRRGPRPYVSDNLSATIIGIYNKDSLDNDVKSQLKEIVRNDMNRIWWEDSKANVISQLNKIGVPEKFFTDGSFNIEKLGKLNTVGTATELAEKIKDMIIEIAATQVTDYILKADNVMKEETDKAVQLVEDFAKKWDVCTDCSSPSTKIKELINQNNYGLNGKIVKEHQNLINQLRTPINPEILNNAGMKLSEVFGIPEDEDVKVIGTVDAKGNIVNGKLKIGVTNKDKEHAYDDAGNVIGVINGNNVMDSIQIPDSEYFVALPARGTMSSLGQKRYALSGNKCTGDCNAGRDFKAPKSPLLNLPPVREVFYFSSIDYQEIPKDKRKKKDKYYLPSISHLLNLKYPNDPEHQWEYLPETWRYLLARPNLRNDGKYQHTFVERSLKGANLRNLIENLDNKNIVGAKASDYYAITGRSGVYPCWTKPFGSNSITKVIIDIDGGAGVGDMQFKYRLAQPEDITNIGECKEIAYNSAANSSCYVYNYQGKSGKKRQSGICHLMADHGENKDVQNTLKIAKNTMYAKYSELGQFLSGDLKYRPLQQNLHEFLINEKNTANDINRQKAEAASFKRNLFGSFLDIVNAEYTARKNMETMEEEITKTLESLCAQIHENGQTASGQKSEDEETCAKYIKSHGGLASSAEDTVYGEEGEYSDKAQAYKGVNCTLTKQPNYYNDLYCKLHEWKKTKLADAKAKYNNITKTFSELERNRVKERLDSINDTIQILTKDDKEILQITPNMKLADVDSNKKDSPLKNAQANRTAERVTDNDGIVAMDNQGQVIPYCPVYIYKYK